MTTDEKKGVVYIATGEKFINEAKLSATSVKENMPDIPITLLTDNKINVPEFDTVLTIESPRHDFGDQVYHLDRTPYDRTIFLDSDIHLDMDIEDLFEVLDEFDIAAAHNQRKYSSDRIDFEAIESIPDCFPEYNSGVVAFKSNPDVKQFVADWQEIYEEVVSRGQVHNQAAFRLALYRSDLRIATLPPEYNCVFRRPGCVNGPIRVFHGRLLDISSQGASKSVSLDQAVSELNSSTDLRPYYRIGDEVHLAEPTVFQRAQRSLRSRGLIGTIKELPEFLKHYVAGQ